MHDNWFIHTRQRYAYNTHETTHIETYIDNIVSAAKKNAHITDTCNIVRIRLV